MLRETQGNIEHVQTHSLYVANPPPPIIDGLWRLHFGRDHFFYRFL